MKSGILQLICAAAIISCGPHVCLSQVGQISGQLKDEETKETINSVAIKSWHIQTKRQNEPTISLSEGKFILKDQYVGQTMLQFYKSLGKGSRYFVTTNVI